VADLRHGRLERPRGYTRLPDAPPVRGPVRPRSQAPRGAGRSAVRTIVRGKNLEVPDRVRQYAERKFARLERLLDDRTDAIVELSNEAHRSATDAHIVDVQLLIDGKTLRSTASGASYQAALDVVVDKVERQAIDFKEKPRVRARPEEEKTILRKLAEEKGIEGRMVDIRELLDQLRSSYDERNERSQESQAQVLASILKAELILIDELGAAKPSDWVYETLELLIGTLYNRARPVIVTTNMGNRGPFNPGNRYEENEYARAARAETLGDRIGLRMWSRLQQMCRPVEINGSDWRQQR